MDGRNAAFRVIEEQVLTDMPFSSVISTGGSVAHSERTVAPGTPRRWSIWSNLDDRVSGFAGTSPAFIRQRQFPGPYQERVPYERYGEIVVVHMRPPGGNRSVHHAQLPATDRTDSSDQARGASETVGRGNSVICAVGKSSGELILYIQTKRALSLLVI